MIRILELVITHIGFIAGTLLLYEYARAKILDAVDRILYDEFSKPAINETNNDA